MMASRPSPSASIDRDTGCVPTLDLHGYRVDEAIRGVTDFLEHYRSVFKDQYSSLASRSPTFATVLIITGTGNHSSAHGGPVLIHAVEDLLQRRQMAYIRGGTGSRINTYGPGTFLVKPNSGITYTYNPRHSPATKQSTKVVTKDQEMSSSPGQFVRHGHDTVRDKKYISDCFQTTPKPSECGGSVDAEYIRALSKTTAISFETLRKEKEICQTEAKELEEAYKLSLISAEIDDIQIGQEERLLQQAILSSSTDSFRPNTDLDDDEQFQIALQLSQQVQREASQEEEELLQQALNASMKDLQLSNDEIDRYFCVANQQKSGSFDTDENESVVGRLTKKITPDATTHVTYDQNDEDEQLKFALDLSQREEQDIKQLEADLLQKALEASKVEIDFEDEMLKQVLQISLESVKSDQLCELQELPQRQSRRAMMSQECHSPLACVAATNNEYKDEDDADEDSVIRQVLAKSLNDRRD